MNNILHLLFGIVIGLFVVAFFALGFAGIYMSRKCADGGTPLYSAYATKGGTQYAFVGCSQ